MVRPSLMGQSQPLLPNMIPLMTPLMQPNSGGPGVRVSQPVVQPAAPVMDPRFQPRPSLPLSRAPPVPQPPVQQPQQIQQSSSAASEVNSNVDQEKVKKKALLSLKFYN